MSNNKSEISLEEAAALHSSGRGGVETNRFGEGEEPGSLSDNPATANRHPDEKKIRAELSDRRLDASTKLYFKTLEVITREHDLMAGALLLTFLDESGEPAEFWLPKKLCRNLDLEENSVYCYTPFLEETKEALLDGTYAEEFQVED